MNDLSPYRILVVDDEPDILTFICSVLEDNGATVIKAMSGEQALAEARRTKPDLVTLDLSMPGKDGGQVFQEMRNDPELGKSILEPIEIFGLQKFDDSAIIVRARLTTKPLKQWGLKREFNRRLKRVFDERGIEIPFPHRTIYMGEPKQGAAPSLNVELKKDNSLPV